MTRERVLMIGEAPGRADRFGRGQALGGRIERRLAMLCDVDDASDLGRAFERTNLLKRWPGPSPGGRGSRFPQREARAAASAMIPSIVGRRVVLVGLRTAAAFGLEGRELFEFQAVDGAPGAKVAIVPHPSGVNRWWNSRSNVERARRFFERLALDGKQGVASRAE